MKTRLLFICCACFILVITGILLNSDHTSTIQKVIVSADYPYYDNLENLMNKADTIIKGKVIDIIYSELNTKSETQSDDKYLNPGGEIDTSLIPYTIFTVEIEKTYKGNIDQKDILEIKQPGGVIGTFEYIYKDNADLEKGYNYIFFLETYPNSPASLLNPIQGSYEYDDNNNIIADEQNNIKFTMKDLDNINSTAGRN